MHRSARRPRFSVAPAWLILVLAGVLAACAGGPARPANQDPRPPEAPPAADPSQPYGPYPTLPVTGGLPPVGNTDRQFPELSVARDGGRYVIDLVDPEARAWWIIVSGTGQRDGDRLEIVAEAGDIWPGAAVNVYVDGELVDTADMNGLIGNSTAIAGGCHPTLDLCFSSGDIDIRPGDGLLSVRLDGTAGGYEIRGATASWAGEPFVLGPWRGTETVPAD